MLIRDEWAVLAEVEFFAEVFDHFDGGIVERDVSSAGGTLEIADDHLSAALRGDAVALADLFYAALNVHDAVANIFIDPDVEHDEAAKDLFPKDFLTVLPTPEKYIGATKIFGYGDADNWDDDRNDLRVEGEYGSAVIPIENEEQEDFYVFKHKKELANDLVDIPPSMKEAIRYFILATAVSDTRLDENEHRSMLVNVSRFTMVQNITADLIDAYVTGLKSDLENYSKLSIDKAMQISGIRSLYHTWEKYHLSDITKQDWNTLLHDHLNKAARRISVRAVNQKHGAASLNYNEEEGLRVIAVGGNSLSRGLTLEGLVVSYFYRNTMMYDTLLQMGRWFGYRFGYEDLFKLWIAEDAIDWYVGYENDMRCFVILDTGIIDHLDSSKAIDVVCLKYSDEKYGMKFLLKYPSLDELFINLCWDLMECSKNSETPLMALLHRYSNWMILLQKAKAGIMSISRQKGFPNCFQTLLIHITKIEKRNIRLTLTK